MEPERQETYERIPWETLEKTGGDRQWLIYAVAAAVVLGALAYSFMKSQPTAAPPSESPSAAGVATTVPATTPPTMPSGSTPTTVASPVVVAEADLYAIDPERLIDQAASHAEWVAVEFVAFDGSEQSHDIVEALLPAGVPLPEAPEGTQVFVDWARARSVTQTGPVSFDVEVIVRSLVSTADSGFSRQPPVLVTVPVEVGESGIPGLGGVPSLASVEVSASPGVALEQPPEELVSGIEGEVAGGIQQAGGGWDLVVLSEGEDGVKRPVTIPSSP